MDAESARSEMSLSWPLYIETEQESARFAEQLVQFIEIHQKLFETAYEMYRKRSHVSLPTMAEIYGPTRINMTAGSRCETEYLIENIGTNSWNNIEIRIETIGGETVENVWAEPGLIGSVSQGKAVKFNLCAEGEIPGRGVVTLLIKTDDFRKSETIRIFQ